MRVRTYAVIGAIALGTWWLATSGSRHTRSTAAGPAAPGYYFKDATLEETDERGRLLLKLHTLQAVENVQKHSMSLQNLAVDYKAAPDSEWLLHADGGSMPLGSEILTLRGHVEMRASGTQAAGAVVHTDLLALDRRHRIASTSEWARIEWPPHELYAQGFRLDLTHRTLALEKSVHGTFHR